MLPEATKLSIIIPAHNEGKAIEKTIESLLANDIQLESEIIIACNGCSDDTAERARKYHGVKIFETADSGMSFGKNFGAKYSTNDFLIFIDADTTLPPNAINKIMQKIGNQQSVIGTVAGRPDRGGIVVKICFLLANIFTRNKRVHAPGGVMLMHRKVFESIGGFNEELPQGTSSDFIMRAKDAGAEYIFISNPKATTSIRRFEKTGIIQQMLAWRKNHKDIRAGEQQRIKNKDYKAIR